MGAFHLQGEGRREPSEYGAGVMSVRPRMLNLVLATPHWDLTAVTLLETGEICFAVVG